MKRQTVWRQIKSQDRIISTETNYEGFPTYRRPLKEQALSALMTGSTANLFYAEAKENVSQMMSVLKQMANEDVEYLAQATIYARNKGFMRTMPIASLVEISKHSPELFKAIATDICQNPHDWQTFLDICRSKISRKGLGRTIKTKIHEILKNITSYYVMKYPKAIEDMINLSRPNSSINSTIIDYIKKGENKGDEKLEALDRLKKAETPQEVANAIKEGNIPYQVVTGSTNVKMGKVIWTELFYQAPYFFLLRNLNNFIRNDVFNNVDNVKIATKKLTNPDLITKSKILPFRYYIAKKMLQKSQYGNILMKALDDALELSIINIPEIEGKVCIASDVSGSMDSFLTGNNSVVTCNDIVGILTGCLIKKCKQKPLLLPFEDKIAWDIVNEVWALKEPTITDIASCFPARNGTSLSAPIEYLIEQRKKVDSFIALTDNEEWIGRGFLDAFLQYKTEIAPECKAFLITLLPYGHVPVPPDIPNVNFIYGWSDTVLLFINHKLEQTDVIEGLTKK